MKRNFVTSFCCFIIHEDLPFGNKLASYALKIEFVVFVNEWINYLFINFIKLLFGYVITSISDLQPSTAIANQLPGQLHSKNIYKYGLIQNYVLT